MKNKDYYDKLDATFISNLPDFIDSNNVINVYAGLNDLPILSNLGKSPFKYSSKRWHSVEQAYMYYKAMVFNDKECANRILNSKNPFDCKSLAKNIKNFNSEKWDDVAYNIMYKLVEESVKQYEPKRRMLLKTQNALLTHKPEKSRWRHDFPEILMKIRHKYIVQSHRN